MANKNEHQEIIYISMGEIMAENAKRAAQQEHEEWDNAIFTLQKIINKRKEEKNKTNI